MNTDAIEAAGAGPLRQVIEEVRLARLLFRMQKARKTNVCSGLPLFLPHRGWISFLGVWEGGGHGSDLWTYQDLG